MGKLFEAEPNIKPHEPNPEDEAQFAEMERLIEEEGWIPDYSVLRTDAKYHRILRKEGFPPREFMTTVPYQKLYGPKEPEKKMVESEEEASEE